MQFTPHQPTEQVNSISRKCGILMNWQLFGLTQDQSAGIIIAYYFVNETAHKQTAQIQWINLAESWGRSAVSAGDTQTHTPILLSHPPNFRGSRGRRSGAIQLRISVLQLNSAVPEQNERPKPSGEKSADNPHLQSPAGNVASLQPFTPSQSCVCVCVCALLTDAFPEPLWACPHSNLWPQNPNFRWKCMKIFCYLHITDQLVDISFEFVHHIHRIISLSKIKISLNVNPQSSDTCSDSQEPPLLTLWDQ